MPPARHQTKELWEFHVASVYNVWGCHNRYFNKYLLLEGIIECTLVVEIMVVNNTELTLEKSGVKGERTNPPHSRKPVCVAQSCPTLCDPMDCSPPGSSVNGDSSGQNGRVGCHPLLQGIFRTQGSNPGLPHCRRILYHVSHQGSPKTSIFGPLYPWFHISRFNQMGIVYYCSSI